MKFERVCLIAHPGKPEAVEFAAELTNFLEARGMSVTCERPHLVLSLGGDGTTLRAAQQAHASDALLLSVNLGVLGYLTEVDAPDAKAALERIFDGDYDIEDRMVLACETRRDGEHLKYVGVNEALVERTSHRLVRLKVGIGGESLAAFNADGVLVATPTGSTAYALSAGGPIVSPRADCLIVVPVSPHMIFSRPFVLAPDQTVEIVFEGVDEAASLTLDGAIGCSLPPGSTVTVARHPRPLKLVRLGGPGFIERLRIKLDLPG